MKKTVLLLSLFCAAAFAQASIGQPFAVLAPLAPVAGLAGAQLAYDTTNKLLYVQSVGPAGGVPTNVLSFNPHVLDNGGSFSVTVSVSGASVGITASTSGANLIYRLTNGNAAQDKFCSTATPLSAGAVACTAIPF